jgi:hypothetical protein
MREFLSNQIRTWRSIVYLVTFCTFLSFLNVSTTLFYILAPVAIPNIFSCTCTIPVIKYFVSGLCFHPPMLSTLGPTWRVVKWLASDRSRWRSFVEALCSYTGDSRIDDDDDDALLSRKTLPLLLIWFCLFVRN